jgi:hypothetical protein
MIPHQFKLGCGGSVRFQDRCGKRADQKKSRSIATKGSSAGGMG